MLTKRGKGTFLTCDFLEITITSCEVVYHCDLFTASFFTWRQPASSALLLLLPLRLLSQSLLVLRLLVQLLGDKEKHVTSVLLSLCGAGFGSWLFLQACLNVDSKSNTVVTREQLFIRTNMRERERESERERNRERERERKNEEQTLVHFLGTPEKKQNTKSRKKHTKIKHKTQSEHDQKQ